MNKPAISVEDVRFIKLGEKARREKECIEGPEPCVRIGSDTGHYVEGLAGNWKVLEDYWQNVEHRTPGKTTEFVNQVKTYNTLGESTLWITLYKQKR